MRGGSRVNSGPPPDPNAVRRDRKSDQDSWTTLDPSARDGKKAPPFPLVRREETAADEFHAMDFEEWIEQAIEQAQRRAKALDVRERKLWTEIWRLPQAVKWKEAGWTYEVALYCRLMVSAERGDSKAASEARQWSDRLGLSSASMLRLRWRVAPDRTEATAPALAAVKSIESKRRRAPSARKPV